jgi:hypothetical protein
LIRSANLVKARVKPRHTIVGEEYSGEADSLDNSALEQDIRL